jgi:ATP-dependent helicase/DNAse subunit B
MKYFSLSKRTALKLMNIARDLGQGQKIRHIGETSSNPDTMSFMKDNLFSYTPEKLEDKEGRINLYSAPGIAAECELAAAKALELVREKGCRFRDIAVAVRNFEEVPSGPGEYLCPLRCAALCKQEEQHSAETPPVNDIFRF